MFTLFLAGCDQAEQVRFHNGSVILTGEIWKPQTGGPHPAAVFIHGPDPRERKDFRDLAKHFAEQGIASLLSDKPGMGESSGDWTKADFQTLAGEARAAVHYLQQRQDIRPDNIGVIGFDLGGGIALLAAGESPGVAFVITLSMPALAGPSTNASVHTSIFDPLSILPNLHAPVLVLFGEKDQAISVEKCVALIEASIRKTEKKSFALRVVPNADRHMFTKPFHDSPLPLLQNLPLWPRFEPEALEAMVYWIKVVAPLYSSQAK